MPLEYEAIRKSFNVTANQYDENAVLQREVSSRLLERLEDEKLIDNDLRPNHILDLGCGTGLAIPTILTTFPGAKISALDFSEPMLNKVDKNLAETICADVHNLPCANNSVDIVFSNMMLHWSNEAEVFIEACRVLKPGGLLLMSCLGETSLFELKHAFSQVDDKPHIHSFPALHDLGDELLKAGFTDVVVNAEIITLTYDNVTALMQDIKASGGHNADENRSKGLMPSVHLKQLSKAYEVFQQDSRLPASYEIVYLRAKKPKSGSINLNITEA
ncbi:MAG: malonyl-ACP O-methyltransferase BioC [Proteobacteria bacterium]|nr:malonyl-ACP O-methyltransferase BioC [Pseudomonadota bacterium]